MKNIYIIGIGLIGGSLALDIKDIYPESTIYGIDENKDHLQKAIQLGIIDQSKEFQDLINADLVLLCVPVDALVRIIDDVLNIISDDTLVIDMGSTKEVLCKAVDLHPKRKNFLAAHPIAGTEFSGPQAAFSGLFNGKTIIVCEVEKTAMRLQDKAFYLFADLGMRIRYMNPAKHDKHIAYVSHLSHISSFMLGKTVIEKENNEQDIFDLAGSGFESTVRLAKSSPEMWTPIFKQNKENIVEVLNDYISNLNSFKQHIEEDDFDAVFNDMKDTNYIKKILKGLDSSSTEGETQ